MTLLQQYEQEKMTLSQQYEQEKMALLQQYEQGKQQQFQSGVEQEKRTIGARLLQLGWPLAEVEAVTGLSLAILQQLQQEVLH